MNDFQSVTMQARVNSVNRKMSGKKATSSEKTDTS